MMTAEFEKKLNILNSEMLKLSKKIDICTYNNVLARGSEFFTEFEKYVCKNTKIDKELSKAEMADILNSIENIFDFSIKYVEMLSVVAKNLKLSFETPQSFLKTSQTIYKKYRNADKYLESFMKNGISISGFKQKKGIPLQSEKHDYISLIIGLILLITSIILAFVFGENSGMQYLITRSLLSIGVALILSGSGKGFINLKIRKNRFLVTATGAFAIFIILFFLNPPSPPEYKTQSEQSQIYNRK